MAAVELYSTSLISDANLQGYWRLEDVNDSSSNGYNLTNNGTVTFSAGKFNNGAVFDGSNNLTIANASCANLEPAGSITWIAWAYPTNLIVGADRAVLGKRDQAQSVPLDDLYFTIPTTDNVAYPTFRLSNLSSTYTGVNSTASATINHWYFMVGRYNASTNKLAIFVGDDAGNLTKTEIDVTGTLGDTNGAFGIGSLGGFSNPFIGQIDDAAVFNRALTDTEVLSLYNGPTAVTRGFMTTKTNMW